MQYSTGVPISPIRKIVKPQKNLIQKVQKPITVFVDPPYKKHDHKASQTEKKDVVNSGDLISDEVSESYWKELAEERRKALNESLHENEQLHKELLELKEENEKLSKVASQAEYFANVLKEVLGAEEDKDDLDDEKKTNINDVNCANTTNHICSEKLNSDECEESQVATKIEDERIMERILDKESIVQKEKSHERPEKSVEESTPKDTSTDLKP